MLNKNLIIYIHGAGGSANEAEYYAPLFNGEVIGFDYKAENAWDAKAEFVNFFDLHSANYKSVVIIANSIGAYFSMHTLAQKPIDRAFFISPIVNMEKLILDMMARANVTEAELRDKQEIGNLSWKYLCYARENPISWTVPTDILYGENDNLTSLETITAFAKKINATLTVVKGGEHWFHTSDLVISDWVLGIRKKF